MGVIFQYGLLINKATFMDADTFLELIKEEARNLAIDWSVGDNVGVSKEAQNWLNNLPDNERKFIQEIVTESVDLSIFRYLEIMDGVHCKNKKPIEARHESEVISGYGALQLHDLFASKI